MSEIGYCEGEVCNRDGCEGVIHIPGPKNCSCHISPPCGECTSDRTCCPECDWVAVDDPLYAEDISSISFSGDGFASIQTKPRILDPSKVDFVCKLHSGSSMIKEGVYPESMTREEVEKEVVGTFGGGFQQFGGGKFRYIAYTD